jgi:hypothetical protein
MTQVLRSLGSGVDVRELVIQVEGMTGAHSSPDRPSPLQLYENYSVEYALTEPKPSRIAVVDDVLTTGAHFKAIKRIPQGNVRGRGCARYVSSAQSPKHRISGELFAESATATFLTEPRIGRQGNVFLELLIRWGHLGGQERSVWGWSGSC